MTKRALEILAIPKGKAKLLLDIGCGSGISGSVVGSKGHMWIGTDISKAMLDVAAEREVEGDVLHSDMGHGFGFRHGTFDGAISISAIQWLCSAEIMPEPMEETQSFLLFALRLPNKGCSMCIPVLPK